MNNPTTIIRNFVLTVIGCTLIVHVTGGDASTQILGWPTMVVVFGGIASLFGLLMGSSVKATYLKTTKVITFIIWVIGGLSFTFGFLKGLGFIINA